MALKFVRNNGEYYVFLVTISLFQISPIGNTQYIKYINQ